MWRLRVPAIILATGLAISPSLYAQTAPDIALPAGDATRGKAIFEGTKGNCRSCHRVAGVGSLFGPDLSAIGSPPRGGGGGGGRGGGGALAPAGTAAPAAAGAAAPPPAATPAPVPPVPGGRGGQAAQGANPSTGPTPQQFAQSILDPNAVVTPQNRYVVLKMKDGKTISGKLLSVDTFAYQIFDSSEKLANISKENIREATMTSPMPSYRDKLTTQELADVISYLTSLNGQ
ncbi:MAG TPA: c-type cytochrome [Terriglobia bacterium]|nr:c-type cytochrome [Terriglobia bacterium]